MEQKSMKSLSFTLFVVIFFAVGLWSPVIADNEGPPRNRPNPNQDQDPCSQTVGSIATLCSGNLMADYVLPSYRSLDVQRSLRFVYNSTAADVRPIFSIDGNANTLGGSPLSVSLRLFLQGQPQGSEMYYQPSSSLFRMAVPFNGNNQPTGVYPYFLSLSNNNSNNTITKNAAPGRMVINNQRNSPFGAGWTLDGLKRIVTNTGSSAMKNLALLLEGDGSSKVFSISPTPPLFDAPRSFDLNAVSNEVAVGDFNNDNVLDLAITSTNPPNISIFLGNGDATYQPPQTFSIPTPGQSITVADLNGDRIPDLVLVNRLSRFVFVLIGIGDGTFQLPPRAFVVGTNPYAVAVGDFNRDGIPDLVVTNQGSDNVSVLLGIGDGNFQPAINTSTGASSQPRVVTVADFNNDNKLDLALLTFGAEFMRISLLFGNNDGTFSGLQSIPVGDASALAVGDFNRDGLPDLVMTNPFYNLTAIFLNDPMHPGTFIVQQPYLQAGGNAYAIIVGDFNNDGIPDLALPAFNTLIWLGNGDGTFSTSLVGAAGNPLGAAAGDLNGDGNLDLVILDQSSASISSFSILLGNGDGTLMAQSFETGRGPRSMAMGDFNQDGKTDLVSVNETSGDITVVLGNGDGTFQPPQSISLGDQANPRAVVVGDFNKDGLLDLAVANLGFTNVSILLGKGDGTFQAPQNFSVAGQAISLVAGDYNRDGTLDLAVVNYDTGNVSILINTTPPGSGTLSFNTSLPPISVGPAPYHIAIGDFNGDEIPDLVVANSGSNYVSVLIGNGDGIFGSARNFLVASTPYIVAVGKLRPGNSPQDLIVGSNTNPGRISILLGNGDGTFQQPPSIIQNGTTAWGLALADFNGDGILDLAVSDSESTVSILLGNGDGSFNLTTRQRYSVGRSPRPIAVADFNGDGKPDLAVGNFNSFTVSLLMSPRRSPMGDYSTLVKNANGSFTRTKKDGTIENFDSNGNLISVADRNGNTTRYTYNANGRLSQITDPVGLATIFTYNAGGNGFVIQDPAGRQTLFTIDPATNQLTQIQDPAQATTKFTYDSNLHLITQTNPRLATTTYQYNAVGRFTQSTVGNVNRSVSAGQLFGLYDPNASNCPRIDDPTCPMTGTCGDRCFPAQVTATAQVKSSFTDGRGIVTNYSTDSFGAATTIVEAFGTTNPRTTTIARDGHRNPTRIVAANGAKTVMSYDGQGNLLQSMTSPDNAKPFATSYTYHPRFNQVTSATDPRGFTTNFDYDDTVTTGCYDFSPPPTPARGNLCRITDVLGKKTEFKYNNQGQVVSVSDKDSAGVVLATTAYTHNTRGNVATVTDPLNRTTVYGYNDDDQAMTEDLTGNVRSVKDAAGNMIRLVYDAMNRTTRRCNAAGNPSLRCIDSQQTGVTQYIYQPVGVNCNALSGTVPTRLLFGVKDANNHCTRFDYDNLNRLQAVTNPLGNQRTFQYDPAGKITQTTNARNQSTIFSYDNFRQLSSKLVNGTDLTCYYYDAVGNLTNIRAKASGGLCTPMPASFQSGLSFQYDLMNRLMQAQTLASTSGQPITTIQYTYDENSNRESMVLTPPSQTLGIAYTYDALNRLEALTDPLAQVSNFTYDITRRVNTTTYPPVAGGILQRTLTYDAGGQFTSLTYVLGTQNILAFNNIQYDGVGNRTVIPEQHGGGSVGTNNYGYDNLYRVISATHPSSPPENFTYDPVGNRLSSHLASSYTYDAANRLTADSHFTYTYDADGNLTSRCQGTTCTTYTWDAENRLTLVTPSGAAVTAYKYDGLGRRIERAAGTSTTRYIYDGGNILATYDGSNNLLQSFTHGLEIDQPISYFDWTLNKTYFYVADALGSVVKIIDSSNGSVAQSYFYDSFGNIVQQTGTINQPYTYTGREWDDAARLYYYRARYYDPMMGRFISEDPVGLMGGINFYTYVEDNPTNFTDPSGFHPPTLARGWPGVEPFINMFRRRQGNYQSPDPGHWEAIDNACKHLRKHIETLRMTCPATPEAQAQLAILEELLKYCDDFPKAPPEPVLPPILIPPPENIPTPTPEQTRNAVAVGLAGATVVLLLLALLAL